MEPEIAPCADIVIDPAACADAAGLVYVNDETPGIRRVRRGRGFSYVDPEGRVLADPALRARIDRLAIPPGWRDVWICPAEEGHVQATGRDEKGRKQYRYHAEWQRVRSETKFSRMVPFARALPDLRARLAHDLSLRGLPRDKVLATVVTLLDRTLIRVGNDEYARLNRSFGLTTLRDRHVSVTGATCTFSFRGKSGKTHRIHVIDRRLAGIVRRCQEIPGHELFQYLDDDGRRQDVTSGDVNAYLRETTGQSFTAKDFRTWGGSVTAAGLLHAAGAPETERQARRNITQVVRQVAARLGNTPTVCRAYYVHPALFEGYLDGTFLPAWAQCHAGGALPQLDADETALLRFLNP